LLLQDLALQEDTGMQACRGSKYVIVRIILISSTLVFCPVFPVQALCVYSLILFQKPTNEVSVDEQARVESPNTTVP
jgi:hypothetical protein